MGFSEQFREKTQKQARDLERTLWYHSIELPDGSVKPGLIGIEQLRARIESFPIPRDLKGRRVLDIGAATGWCSFEMERRGADVVAVDCVRYDELLEAKELLGSKVDYRVLDMEEITVEELGRFDYVLFFGVLYHLRHPLLALENVCAMTRDTAFVESFVIDALDEGWRASEPLMKFYPRDELGGQIDNWCGPNLACLEAMCQSAGFAQVQVEYRADTRAGLTCRRKPRVSPGMGRGGERPWINSVVNNRLGDAVFHAGRDEYLCIYFKTQRPGLRLEDVEVAIDEDGAPLLTLNELGRQGWQANLRLPPGLEPGRHEVRIRAGDGSYSEAFPITVRAFRAAQESQGALDLATFLPIEEASAGRLDLYEVENTIDQSKDFRGYRKEMLACYFLSLENDLTRETVLVRIGEMDCGVASLTRLWNGGWQANVRIPGDLGPGRYKVCVRSNRSGFSEPMEIRRLAEG